MSECSYAVGSIEGDLFFNGVKNEMKTVTSIDLDRCVTTVARQGIDLSDPYSVRTQGLSYSIRR
ncbi:hypothetical protein J6590_009716 [Homalodisca vitripennis]|nr:hypothetical protein J6590_009716 [Homalodisca vitripennis]